MSVRNTTSHALAERARKAGWTVSNPRGMGGAYMVTMPKGKCAREDCNHIVNIHLTPSEMNAERVILRKMLTHGLTADEKRGEKKRNAERLAAIEAGRIAAEKKAAALLKQAKAVNRAAGPYAGPELVEDAWFFTAHPAPTFRWVIMTPEQAQRILDTINTHNRPISDDTVEHYRGIIVSNQWHLTHQGMAIDEDGVLQDGQHRLKAIVGAGIAVPLAFFAGMARENFKAIDEGLARTAAQLFGRDGESYRTVLQGLVKLLNALKNDNPRKEWRRKLTNEQIYDAFGGDDELREAAEFAGRYAKKALATPVGLAAAYYMIRKANGPDNPYVAAFFNGYVNGRKDHDLSLHPDDPRLRLREYTNNLKVGRKRLSPIGAYAVTVRCWNYVISGRKVHNMRWADNSEVPRVDVAMVSPLGAVYSCPDLLRGEVEDAPPAEAEAEAPELVAA